MITVKLGEVIEDKEILRVFFSEKELDLAKDCRVDKDFITSNGYAIHAYACEKIFIRENHQVKVAASIYYSESLDGEVLPNVQLEEESNTESNNWVKTQNGKVILAKTKKLTSICTWAQINGIWVAAYPLKVEEGTFQLKDGTFAIGQYGKYMPNLTFISPIPILQWENIDRTVYNLPNGDLSIIRGDFFTSKKGTKCFKVKQNGSHILLRDSWGGCFNRYRGGVLPENQLYFRRASSNGGGSGYDYAVIPKNWLYSLSEEDL